ncbi:hypothetical protein [Bosea sp. CS1GBMeth4]|uniref:hypothetical protein n=1 Tax=Bosea sp. CS1GBMeth4 TaxID=1892849 RepID=UPI001647D239|nr:hypothetical protein [Bosea sp. CS1GBMeth4]
MLLWPDRRTDLLQVQAPADLYEAYSLACEAVHWWGKRAGSPEAAAIAEEYRELIAALEREISDALVERTP